MPVLAPFSLSLSPSLPPPLSLPLSPLLTPPFAVCDRRGRSQRPLRPSSASWVRGHQPLIRVNPHPKEPAVGLCGHPSRGAAAASPRPCPRPPGPLWLNPLRASARGGLVILSLSLSISLSLAHYFSLSLSLSLPRSLSALVSKGRESPSAGAARVSGSAADGGGARGGGGERGPWRPAAGAAPTRPRPCRHARARARIACGRFTAVLPLGPGRPHYPTVTPSLSDQRRLALGSASPRSRIALGSASRTAPRERRPSAPARVCARALGVRTGARAPAPAPAAPSPAPPRRRSARAAASGAAMRHTLGSGCGREGPADYAVQRPCGIEVGTLSEI